MPKDTLEQRIEAARRAAIETHSQLKGEERQAGEHWNIAPLELRIEKSQEWAAAEWKQETEQEKEGNNPRRSDRDPFVRDERADQVKDSGPDVDRDQLRSR